MNFLLLPIQFLLFNLILKTVFFVVRMLFKALVFSPQIITGYIICLHFLNRKDAVGVWITCIVMVATLIYLFIVILKTILLAMMQKGNWLWLPLSIVCIAYTCIFPVWILFDSINHIMLFISKDHAALMTWLCSLCLGLYIFTHYNFFSSRH